MQPNNSFYFSFSLNLYCQQHMGILFLKPLPEKYQILRLIGLELSLDEDGAALALVKIK
jgi:hypothetical protein